MFLINRFRGAFASTDGLTAADNAAIDSLLAKHAEESSEYPIVQPGGSLLLAWQVKNKRVLMVGGGNVAAGRILNLLNADSLVTLICPTSGLHPETAFRVKHHPDRITYIPREFIPTDLDDPSITLVMTAIDDPVASSQIYKLCKAKRMAVNVADVPPECDFYFGSVHRDGPLQIMVSTNGNGPRLAAMVRKKIAASLPENTGAAIVKVGKLRMRLRRMVPGPAAGAKRMEWMSKVCDEWTLDDLCAMNEADMDELLKGYEGNTVKSYDEIVKLNALMDAVKLGEEEDDVKE